MRKKLCFHSSTLPLLDQKGYKIGTIMTLNDITTHKNLMDKLDRMASVDVLTGIYNRCHLIRLSEKEVEKAKRSCYPLSMFLIGLDHFKSINDSFGHTATISP
jgi:GGDEF domain-containing protein